MSSPDDAASEPLDQRAFIAELSRQLIGKAAEVRHALIDLAAQADNAPIGSCLSLVDIVCALYYQFLHLDFEHEGAPHRDRVILSKAHAALTLQPVLAELGLLDAGAYGTLDADHCRAPGVPDLPCGPGLDAAPALPGTGLGLAVGRALAAQLAGDSRPASVRTNDPDGPAAPWLESQSGPRKCFRHGRRTGRSRADRRRYRCISAADDPAI